mmetsp:Transcript_2298/g.3599  ORF Transcript_2298/g.3599 Transcript_2298/m.3599 type:complete len:87 (+) Transcript_2298:229-489(+)
MMIDENVTTPLDSGWVCFALHQRPCGMPQLQETLRELLKAEQDSIIAGHEVVAQHWFVNVGLHVLSNLCFQCCCCFLHQVPQEENR